MSDKKNILIVGGDGFCGWPTTLEMISRGHTVVIIDNFMRREIDKELGANSITDIKPLEQRIDTAKDLISESLHFEQMDASKDYDLLVDCIRHYNIDTIVHFGEIKSAPYSMIDSTHMRHTVDHNMSATTNILTAIVNTNTDIHLVHLGTMGVYGYNDRLGEIPEGYLDVNVNSTKQDVSILFPTDPGSIYHMTKSMDQLMFQYYNKNWGIQITDLHQGVVWGAQTELTKKHSDLVNRFDYDGVYGTVLNRFVVQAAVDHPLTVHGTGGQNRAFIHIEDTAKCIRLSIENPPKAERVRIFNQMTEILNIKELAELIGSKTGTKLNCMENPRNEPNENNLFVQHSGLEHLGLDPITLNDELINDVMFIAENYKQNIHNDQIVAKVKWK